MDWFGAVADSQAPSADRFFASQRSIDFNWDVFERDGLVNQAVDALLNGPGTLLEGPAGSGKRTMAAAVMRRLHGKALILDLGFPEQQRATLAFSRVLDRVEHQDEETKFQELSGAHEMLERESGGRPVVVFVPEALRLGSHAISFLSALALANAVALLCLTTTLPSANHQERDDLIGSVRLQRIRLMPLTLSETHRRMGMALGGEVSRATSYQLWRSSSGQLHLIAALVQDWYEQCYLVRSGNVWVVNGAKGPIGPRSRAIHTTTAQRAKGKELETLQLLALSEEIPLSALMSVGDADVVDSVHAQGLLEIRGRYSRKVSLQGTLSHQVVADATAPGKARELLEIFLGVPGNEALLKPSVRLKWQQIAGLPTSPGLVHDAALEALSEGHADLCLEILNEGHDASPETDLVRLEALIGGGYLEHAGEILERLRALFGSGIPAPDFNPMPENLAHMIRLEIAATQIAAIRSHSHGGRLREIFAATRDAIAAWINAGRTDSQRLQELAGKLDLIESEVLYRVGERLWISNPPYTHPNLRADDLLRWQFFHNLHSVRAGHVRSALRRGEELVLLLQQDLLPVSTNQRIRQHLADLYLISGEWSKALTSIEAAWTGGEESPRIVEIKGLYASLVYVFMGHTEDALQQLQVEIEQLRTLDPDGQLPLAIAAAALAASSVDEVQAAGHLAELDLMPTPAQWETAQAVAVLTAIVHFHLGAREKALRMLHDQAEENLARGAFTLELTNRMMLLRFGHREGLEKLLSCSARIDGSLAATVESLVRHFGETESSERAQAVTEAWAMGHKSFATAVESQEAANPRQIADLRTAGPLYVLPESDTGEIGAANGSASVRVSSLTNRQRMIVAEVATGASNKEISERLQVKVRTVEGHLYQIYQRLDVGSRLDLGKLYLDAMADSAGRTDNRSEHT
ncbi:LuxR C-terminal-related transcriptional regulator [Paeniglutamicibacter kerguelensis]|uniref:DNA-binding CsgD family transcriptional regulator n=1 Tax=Paeniglutamicibacter kerguelensis TaxID=254788 RepID=A0ABS4XB60_9MICC|nr:DNA-binding CsgD family transcriptional regulator [Paeniglutamicibacter kerguelensis]